MLRKAGKKEEVLMGKLGDYTNKLVRSGVCVWQNIDKMPLKDWPEDSPEGHFILALQHTTNSISCFKDGLRQKPEPFVSKVGKAFLHESRTLRKAIVEYSTSMNLEIDVKLWTDDLSREINEVIKMTEKVLELSKSSED